MTTIEVAEKEARRAAYATYVESFWSLRRLPLDDARRPAQALATQRAETVWRALMTRAMGGVRPNCSYLLTKRGRARTTAPLFNPALLSFGDSPSIGDD